jgi:hypothetical protein
LFERDDAIKLMRAGLVDPDGLQHTPVMAGLVPAIHVLGLALKFMDGRDFARP